jgi:hypothetical protein
MGGGTTQRLDQFVDPDQLTAVIQQRDFFFDVDPLNDPFGEPPRNSPRSVSRAQGYQRG